MTTKQVKLEVNRDYFNNNFESYRYNRDAKYSLFKKQLPEGGKFHSFKLGNCDYSYCHAAMSSSISSLYPCLFNLNKVYLVSEIGTVLASNLVNDDNGSVQLELQSVFTIPDFNSQTMHASLSFPSKTRALILLSTKGDQKIAIQKPNTNIEQLESNYYQVKLFILERAYSENLETWNLEFSLEVSSKQLYSGLNLLGASHLHLFDSTSKGANLRLIIGSIYECFQVNPQVNADRVKSRFGTIFHRLQVEKSCVESSNWSVTENKRFIDDPRASNDFPKYVSLGNEDDVVIVSQCRMRFSPLEEEPTIDQSDSCSSEIRVLKATEPDEELLDAEAVMEVERQETEAIMKSNFTKAVFDEYENCDLLDSASSLLLTQFDSQTGQVLAEVDLSAQQWLFSMANYSPTNRLPFFVTRHDVDAFIYEPRSISPLTSAQVLSADERSSFGAFQVKHIDSFPAFGYVYASKQNRRFMTFCQEVNGGKPEWNYAVIDNWIDQLIYVYKKPSLDPADSNIKPNNGQQFLFHFGQNEGPSSVKGAKSMINGLYALPRLGGSAEQLPQNDEKRVIYLLTDEALYAVQF